MKTKIHPLLSACLLFTASLGLQTTLAQAQVTILDETFEAPKWATGDALTSTAIHGWTGNNNEINGNGALRARISNRPAGSPERIGSQSLYLYRQGSSTAQAAYRLPEMLSNGYVEFDYKYATGSGGGLFYLYLTKNPPGATNNIIFAISGGEFLFIPLNGDRKTISFADAGYTLGSWDTFRVTFDNEAKTLAVSINGEEISELTYALPSDSTVPLWAETVSFRVGSGNDASGYVDNVKIVNNAIPEPSTVGLMMGAAVAALVACRLRRSK